MPVRAWKARKMVTEEYKGLYAPIRKRSELLNDIAYETALAPLLSEFLA